MYLLGMTAPVPLVQPLIELPPLLGIHECSIEPAPGPGPEMPIPRTSGIEFLRWARRMFLRHRERADLLWLT